MRISAEQLTRIVLDLMGRYSNGPYDMSNPETVWSLIQRDYPSVDGVSAPPSDEDIRRRFIGDFWASYTAPTLETRSSGPTIGPESAANIEYNARLRAAGITPEMMDPGRRLLAELDLLRGNPIAALSFVTSTAMGRNRDEAMRVAAATGAVYDLASGLVAGTSGEISHSSGPTVSSGRPPDAYSDSEIRSRIARGYHGGI